MNDLTLGILISVGTTLLIGGIFLLDRRARARRTAKLLAAAAERGWECTSIKEGRTSGYQIEGRTQGIAWSLESTLTTSPTASGSGATSHQSRHTHWQSASAALADGLILIGPRSTAGPIPDTQALGGLAGMVVQKAMELMLGEDAALFPGLREVPLGSGELRERFMVWAQDERAARRLLTFTVERALTDWPSKIPPVVKMNPRGTQIDLQNAQLLDPAALEQLVNLGIELIQAWQS
ncbi:MAG: hypothetical protein JW892_14520 [Anaerolineae bacterium]|nr:hypothetical protein [Anaerolineae bacterium]